VNPAFSSIVDVAQHVHLELISVASIALSPCSSFVVSLMNWMTLVIVVVVCAALGAPPSSASAWIAPGARGCCVRA
jgi:hypothetical protein